MEEGAASNEYLMELLKIRLERHVCSYYEAKFVTEIAMGTNVSSNFFQDVQVML